MYGDSGSRSPLSSPAVEKHGGRRYGESGLRLPLFDGHDWPGFIAQFETCARHYKWSDEIKAVRLFTSIVGEARRSLGTTMTAKWSYSTLKQHLENRYGKNKRFEQIQEELFALSRKSSSNLQEYYDQISRLANTADITESERQKLVYNNVCIRLAIEQAYASLGSQTRKEWDNRIGS